MPKNPLLMYLWIIVFLLVFTGSSFAEHEAALNQSQNTGKGPSFDCAKAKTDVEKLICGSAELSKMDLELSESYKKLNSGIGDAEKTTLKKEQIEWIKARSKNVEVGILTSDQPENILKKKEANLKKEYEERLTAIKAQLEKLPVKDAVASAKKPQDFKPAESASQSQSASLPPEKTEAEKAQRVKEILEKYPMKLDRTLSEDVKFCNTFFKALKRNDKSIDYIEPVLKTDDPIHKDLKQYHSCNNNEDNSGSENSYENIGQIGGKGFKIYRIDLDRNRKNGIEEYLYAEIDYKNPYPGRLQGCAYYSRIDFSNCTFEDNIIVNQIEENSSKNKFHDNINAIIKYQKTYYILDLYDSRTSYNTKPSYSLTLTMYSSSKNKFERGPIGFWQNYKY